MSFKRFSLPAIFSLTVIFNVTPAKANSITPCFTRTEMNGGLGRAVKRVAYSDVPACNSTTPYRKMTTGEASNYAILRVKKFIKRTLIIPTMPRTQTTPYNQSGNTANR